jgi:L-lactate dehydrogenase complex protein LldF
MVSEEIRLNHALGQYNLEVIETDLGEYIVQLRGEPPSHIITPAVHLRRQDVGRLFHEMLGIPYTEDIPVMTEVARKTLRQVFLNADIGISGVNFGVAETGTLCVVTNEGNGRMVTTLPPVHIALMGIERLVPSMDDLALMLTLLPRSATGQKLSVYTSLVNSPRRLNDPDGPMERHVILVDNGRRAVQASRLREILYCIRCGACLNACPVFREIGGHAYVNRTGKSSPYPGPIGSVVSPALFGQSGFGHLARASSLCGACREACPVDIDLPSLLLRVRAGIKAEPLETVNKPNVPLILGWGLKLYAFFASSARRFTFLQRLAGIFGWLAAIASGGNAWLRLPALTGWGYSKDFPVPSVRSFHARYKEKGLVSAVTPDLEPVQESRLASNPSREGSVLTSTLSLKGEFESELTAVGGNFYECTSSNLADKIQQVLSTKGISELLCWEASNLPARLLEQLTQVGIHSLQPTSENIQAASRVRAGLTGALAGIANTGSLVLTGGSGQPLTASLLPLVHLAILREQDIQEDLRQVLSLEALKQAPAAVIITGPSRTADIEMALTIGVHGPGELHVFVITDH